jgi:hypothetical protein
MNGLAICLVSVLALSCASAPSANRADEERLLALHEETLEAHRRSDVEMLLRSEAQDHVMVNRGEISRPTLEQRRAFLGPYLRATRFTEYVDAIPPIVRVSQDGTLGWVIVQVRVRGEQVGASGASRPRAFEAARIELYEKRANAWRRVGNGYNFKG